MYVDGVFTGAETVEKALRILCTICAIRAGGFELHKWSYVSELLIFMPIEQKSEATVIDDQDLRSALAAKM